MKLTKRLLSLVMVLALLASLSAAASAEEAQYKTTKAFLEEIREVPDFQCELMGIVTAEGENYEMVRVKYVGEVSDYESNLQLLFSEDCGEVQLYLYKLISFQEEKLAAVLKAVNALNSLRSCVKYYVDLSDNTVTAGAFQILCEEDPAALTMMALGATIGYTDSAYEMLREYAA